jgi:hypothetical protein
MKRITIAALAMLAGAAAAQAAPGLPKAFHGYWCGIPESDSIFVRLAIAGQWIEF